jgi:methylenetetrahydrofolate reductase (NADPH)
MLDRFAESGLENVLALRGDPPRGATDFAAPDGGLTCATELAGLISERGGFAIGGSSFPEIHPEAASPEADIAYLKTKVDAGATFLITQLFFDNSVYFDWLEEVRGAGIEVPVIPGIIPVASYAGLVRFCGLCGANIPDRLATQMEALGGDAEAEAELGIAYAARQCEELLAAGAPGIHFYTLNKAPATRAVLGALKIARPWERAPAGPVGTHG